MKNAAAQGIARRPVRNLRQLAALRSGGVPASARPGVPTAGIGSTMRTRRIPIHPRPGGRGRFKATGIQWDFPGAMKSSARRILATETLIQRTLRNTLHSATSARVRPEPHCASVTARTGLAGDEAVPCHQAFRDGSSLVPWNLSLV
jgi:hypothetical protein